MQNRIILSLDELSLDACLNLVSRISDRIYAVKIHNLYDAHGPSVVRRLYDAGARKVWVDAKLHDIPNTVRLRSEAIASSGANILSVHASGGIAMMKAAVAGFASDVYAVTLPTSLSEQETRELYGQSAKEKILYFAGLAKLAGVLGVVCSANEVGFLSKQPELQGLEFIVPGVRSFGKEVHDQQRVDTPRNAHRCRSPDHPS